METKNITNIKRQSEKKHSVLFFCPDERGRSASDGFPFASSSQGLFFTNKEIKMSEMYKDFIECNEHELRIQYESQQPDCRFDYFCEMKFQEYYGGMIDHVCDTREV